jgi:hypothetical protein
MNGFHETEPLVDTAEMATAPGSPDSIAASTVAPLGSDFDEISLDGTSVTSNDSTRIDKPEDLTPEDKERAKAIKSEANRHFGLSDYQIALDLYTQSLNVNPFDPATWCNRKLHGLLTCHSSPGVRKRRCCSTKARRVRSGHL